MYVSKNPFAGSELFFRCMFATYKDLVIEDALHFHDRNVYLENVHYGEIFDMNIMKDPVLAAIFGSVFTMVILGVILTIWDLCKKKYKKKENVTEDAIDSSIKELNMLLTQYYKEKEHQRKPDLIRNSKIKMKKFSGNDLMY